MSEAEGKREPIKRERVNVLSLFFPLDKLSRNMVKNLNAARHKGRPCTLDVGGRKDSQKVVIRYAVKALKLKRKGVTVEGLKDLTPADALLHDVICSIYVAGYKAVTVDQVYTTMNGKKSGNGKRVVPSAQRREALLDRIVNMMCQLITIDTREAAAQYKKWTPCAVTTGLLPISIVKQENEAGKESIFLVFNSEPPLVALSKALNQVSGFPIEVLHNEKSRLLKDGAAFRVRYLLERVARVRGRQGSILFQTFFRAAGIGKEHEHRERQKIISVLENLKSQKIIEFFEVNGPRILITKPKKAHRGKK